MLAPTELNIASPCRSRMYFLVDSYRYPRRSPKISITVLFGGRGGMSLTLKPCSATRWGGRRCNLNLVPGIFKDAPINICKNIPFSPNQIFDFHKFRIYFRISFRADGNDLSIFVVANDTWYFRVAADLLLTRKSEEKHDEYLRRRTDER